MKRENQIHFHQSTKTLLISFAYLLAIGASKEAPFIFNFQCEDQVLWRANFYQTNNILSLMKFFGKIFKIFYKGGNK